MLSQAFLKTLSHGHLETLSAHNLKMLGHGSENVPVRGYENAETWLWKTRTYAYLKMLRHGGEKC